jgi:regulator of replication initiation timing
MNSEIIRDLEENVERAMQAIAGLKNQKSILEKENESLRRQVESLRKQLEENVRSAGAEASRHHGFDGRDIKARLESLVTKLAALEDSWS